MIQYGKEIETDLREAPGFVGHVDFRGVKDFTIAYTDTMRIREVFARLREMRGYRGSVILVDTDFQYGMVRMASTVVEMVRPIHVARNETEAAAKLQEILAGQPPDE